MTIEDILRAKCFNSFEFFTRYFFKAKKGEKFILSRHHRKIIEVFECIERGESTRDIINIAPRYGKTELLKMFVAWCLAKNPKSRWIHLSYSDQLALDNSEEIKDMIQSDEYQRLFPYVQIKPDSRAKNKWYTTEGGGMLARSSSGQVIGFGAGVVDNEDNEEDFGGAIIIDDPLKPDDAYSETMRERVNNKFETTIRTRTNSRKTPIVIIMQRLHENDLCGYLMEKEPETWNVTSMPVITNEGEALWEHKHTLKELEELRRIDEFVFDTQYMQNPMPKEGLLFPKDSLNYFNGLTPDDIIGAVSFVDIADTGEDNHAVPIGLITAQGIYITDVLFTKQGTTDNVDLTANILNKHNPEYCRVESNFGGNMYISLLQPKINKSIMLLPVKATSNKHSRITQLSGFIKKFVYFRNDYDTSTDYGKFMVNLTTYTKSGKVKHDDAPDALHGLCQMARTFYPELYQVDASYA